MKMKKLLTLCVGALTAISLVGCFGGGGDKSAGNNEAKKPLIVGSSIDFAPFEFQDETKKEYQGFDMDLIRAIGKEMGREVNIQNLGFDGLIPALQAKNVDVVISGMTINDERKQRVLFSEPYYQSGLTMVVREDNNDIKTFNDLKGKKVAVQIGTTSASTVKAIDGITVTELNTPSNCFMELKAGGVDAVVNDRPVNDYFIAQKVAVGVKTLNEVLSAEDYGIAMAKDNFELQKSVNDALKKLRENGEYDKIYKKWFGK